MGAQQTIIVILRFIHIVAGTFWVGATAMAARFVLPSIAAAGPAGGNVMREIVARRRLPIALNVAGVLTLLAGIGLYGFNQAGSNGAWAQTRMGISITIGAVLAIIASVISNVRSRPAAKKLTALGEQITHADGPPPTDVVAEMDRLRGQLTTATNQSAVLLVLATAAMAVARYI